MHKVNGGIALHETHHAFNRVGSEHVVSSKKPKHVSPPHSQASIPGFAGA
jgi:hypothetical protein